MEDISTQFIYCFINYFPKEKTTNFVVYKFLSFCKDTEPGLRIKFEAGAMAV